MKFDLLFECKKEIQTYGGDTLFLEGVAYKATDIFPSTILIYDENGGIRTFPNSSKDKWFKEHFKVLEEKE